MATRKCRISFGWALETHVTSGESIYVSEKLLSPLWNTIFCHGKLKELPGETVQINISYPPRCSKQVRRKSRNRSNSEMLYWVLFSVQDEIHRRKCNHESEGGIRSKLHFRKWRVEGRGACLRLLLVLLRWWQLHPQEINKQRGKVRSVLVKDDLIVKIGNKIGDEYFITRLLSGNGRGGGRGRKGG